MPMRCLVCVRHIVWYNADMKSDSLDAVLLSLSLTPAELAYLLAVNPRTVSRWLDGSVEMPAAVIQLLRAWQKLKGLRVAWRPDEIDVEPVNLNMLAEQLDKLRQHEGQIDAMCVSVNARGGCSLEWEVDLDKGSAHSGAFHLGFYRLANGSFSPSTFRRSDGRSPDLLRDRHIVEDAIFAIAQKLGRAT